MYTDPQSIPVPSRIYVNDDETNLSLDQLYTYTRDLHDCIVSLSNELNNLKNKEIENVIILEHLYGIVAKSDSTYLKDRYHTLRQCVNSNDYDTFINILGELSDYEYSMSEVRNGLPIYNTHGLDYVVSDDQDWVLSMSFLTEKNDFQGSVIGSEKRIVEDIFIIVERRKHRLGHLDSCSESAKGYISNWFENPTCKNFILKAKGDDVLKSASEYLDKNGHSSYNKLYSSMDQLILLEKLGIDDGIDGRGVAEYVFTFISDGLHRYPVSIKPLMTAYRHDKDKFVKRFRTIIEKNPKLSNFIKMSESKITLG